MLGGPLSPRAASRRGAFFLRCSATLCIAALSAVVVAQSLFVVLLLSGHPLAPSDDSGRSAMSFSTLRRLELARGSPAPHALVVPEIHGPRHTCSPCARHAAEPSPRAVAPGQPPSDADAVGAALRARFTDMTCNLFGDESEVCVYDNVLCYDGDSVVLAVPAMPLPSKGDPNGMGLVLGDPTGGCFDWRYYEPSALAYSACKYDLKPFVRTVKFPPPAVHTMTPSRSFSRSVSAKPGGAAPRAASRAASTTARPTPHASHRPPVGAEWPLPLTHRRWGPANRGAIKFREVRDDMILGPRPPGVTVDPYGGGVFVDDVAAARAAFDSGAARRGAPGPGATPGGGYKASADPKHVALTALGLRIGAVTRTRNFTAYWLDGGLYLTAMDAQFDRHIYHATTRLIGLYHAQRANATAFGESEGDGFLPPLTERNHPLEATFTTVNRFAWAPWEADEMDERAAAVGGSGRGAHGRAPALRVHGNRVTYHTTAGWDLPPQDFAVLAGINGVEPKNMIAFLKGIAELSLQPGGTFVSNAQLTGVLNPGSTLLCARRGAITGTHPKIFVNRADAWVFRRRAYAYAGAAAAGLQPHMHHPPRRITVLLRPGKNGRNFENSDAVLRLVRETGLPYDVIEDLGNLSFKEQIKTMAATGILLAAHGAALVNAMFLPQHAVVIEIFPWLLKKMTYVSLSGLMGLWYLPVYTGAPTMTNTELHGIKLAYANATNGQNFFEGCVAANMSSVDSLLHHRCNSVSKHLPILVDEVALRHTLAQAVDIIAAYSPLNDAYRAALAGGGDGKNGSGSVVTVAATAVAAASQSPTSKRATARVATTAAAGGSIAASSSRKAAPSAAAAGAASQSATRTRTRTATRTATPTPPSAADEDGAAASEQEGAEEGGGKGDAPEEDGGSKGAEEEAAAAGDAAVDAAAGGKDYDARLGADKDKGGQAEDGDAAAAADDAPTGSDKA